MSWNSTKVTNTDQVCRPQIVKKKTMFTFKRIVYLVYIIILFSLFFLNALFAFCQFLPVNH